jgi:hypothetical protein
MFYSPNNVKIQIAGNEIVSRIVNRLSLRGVQDLFQQEQRLSRVECELGG